MPIPDLNADGLLPEGIYDCTLPEIQARFGAFRGSDRRVRLFSKLREMVEVLKGSGFFEILVVDGSFVTAKEAPNDVDLIAVLRS